MSLSTQVGSHIEVLKEGSAAVMAVTAARIGRQSLNVALKQGN